MLKKLFILSGGPGKENIVSISSGKNVVTTLKNEDVQCEEIIVRQDGMWEYEGKLASETEGISLLKENNALVFQVIHGTYGEDGGLSSILEHNGVSYIGSGLSAMENTINKHKTEKILKEKGINATNSLVVNDERNVKDLEIAYPAIVKPINEGSSISLYKVNNKEELAEALIKSLPLHETMLVQEYISGREFTCGVVELDGETIALFPTEIILTKGETFDYEAKYTPGGCLEVTPAEISQELTTKIQNVAISAHAACGCKDISRTDMILKENGELVVLEINTVPGMTKTSFIPAQLAASGYSVTDFIKGMIVKYS